MIFNFLKKKITNEDLIVFLNKMIFDFIVTFCKTRTEEERYEIAYFLLYQVDRMLFVLNQEKRDEIFDKLSLQLLISLVKQNPFVSLNKDIIDLFSQIITHE